MLSKEKPPASSSPAPQAQKPLDKELRAIAAWIRTPGNINRDDAIDECARVLENRAADLKSAGQPFNGWQDISTAPRDLTFLLLWAPGMRVTEGFFDVAAQRFVTSHSNQMWEFPESGPTH